MSFVLNINAGPEDDLRALMGRPPGAGPLDLGEPFKVLSSGVYFAPDPHSWALLAPSEQRALAPPPGMGESVIADEVRPYWRRVLPFPFSAPQLLRFAEYAMLPALCEWMERDQEDPAFDDMLADAPRALALARFLAGGAPALPALGEVLARQHAQAAPVQAGRRRRVLCCRTGCAAPEWRGA
jgi:hypothetical protein